MEQNSRKKSPIHGTLLVLKSTVEIKKFTLHDLVSVFYHKGVLVGLKVALPPCIEIYIEIYIPVVQTHFGN